MKRKEKRQGRKTRKAVLIISGGVLQSVKGLPKGITLEVRDYDTDGVDDAALKVDRDGDCYNEVVWIGGA